MAKGKTKGSSWEREISRSLTQWATGQNKELHFWRSPSSGALFTINNAQTSEISGDIVALTPEGQQFTNIFSIEVKVGYPDTDFFQYFKNVKKFNIEEFWKQCCNDAMSSNKHPMLIYKKDRMPTLVGVSDDISKRLSIDFPNMILKFDNLPKLVLCNSDIFFDTISYKYLVDKLINY